MFPKVSNYTFKIVNCELNYAEEAAAQVQEVVPGIF